MLSVLFAAEACYIIKGNNKEKSFCQGKLPLCRHKLPFCWWKMRKAYFVLIFFCSGKRNLNCKGWTIKPLNNSYLLEKKLGGNQITKQNISALPNNRKNMSVEKAIKGMQEVL